MIVASSPDTDIWLGDDHGFLVQKETVWAIMSTPDPHGSAKTGRIAPRTSIK
jgi:hypothetical protein